MNVREREERNILFIPKLRKPRPVECPFGQEIEIEAQSADLRLQLLQPRLLNANEPTTRRHCAQCAYVYRLYVDRRLFVVSTSQ
jgi:hypothetical protein